MSTPTRPPVIENEMERLRVREFNAVYLFKRLKSRRENIWMQINPALRDLIDTFLGSDGQ